MENVIIIFSQVIHYITSVSLFTKFTSTVTTNNNFSKNKNIILARMLIV